MVLLFPADGLLFASFLHDALFEMVFVVQDASVPLGDRAVLADPDLFGALVDESKVVAYKNHTAFKIVNSVGLKRRKLGHKLGQGHISFPGTYKSVNSFHVQMIRRFVHQQEMWHLPRQISENDSASLSIRQLANRANLRAEKFQINIRYDRDFSSAYLLTSC